MFSQEINGYRKSEVDSYIQRVKANYEAKLMEEKLKVLDAEKKVLDLKNERFEIENKEKNIMTALNVIEKAKHFQEEGSKNFYKLIMDKLELLVSELNLKFPQLKHDRNFENILEEFSNMIKSYRESLERVTDITHPVNSENDSMRILLNKMQDYKKGQEPPKEVHISITNKTTPTTPPSESGFSFEEALNPTEDLEEIMKAFDFYNKN
ncbi:MAG: hypothetical protein ACI4R8_03930 [Candidatus Caccovivens sp.]